MKFKFFPVIFVISAMTGCSREKGNIVNRNYIDSLINQYRASAFVISNDSSILFWKQRIDPKLPGLVSETKYAGALSMRFHLFGDVQDIQKADSVIRKLDSNFNHKEAQAQLTLMRYAILQH